MHRQWRDRRTSRALFDQRALLWDIGWTGTCGNGTVDGQEECDNGAANSDRTPDACRLDCLKAKCGDGVVDTGEDCDPGSAGVGTASNPSCASDCKRSTPTGTGGANGSGGSGGGTGGKGGSGGSGTGGKGGAGGSSSTGGTGSGGSGGNGGSGGSDSGGSGGTATGTTNHPTKSGGCGCHTAHESSGSGFAVLAVGLAIILGRRMRRRR